MIFAKQHFNLEPASPATRDRFMGAAGESHTPAAATYGGRLLGAWFCHEEWFSQIVQVHAFEDLAAYEAFAQAKNSDTALAKAEADLIALAPEHRVELLETLGPVRESVLEESIEAAATQPAGVYTFAILEVAPGKMDSFKGLLAGAAGALPIVASWRDLGGNPMRVTDVWRGDLGKDSYAPSTDQAEAFFGPLRQVAPRERLVRMHPLPYSPLR